MSKKEYVVTVKRPSVKDKNEPHSLMITSHLILSLPSPCFTLRLRQEGIGIFDLQVWPEL